jgi:DNA-directed RNA polymerase subunit beta'
MRTFHIGGVAGSDITQGLPRVQEIFEARQPKGEAMISEVDGKVISILSESSKTVSIKVETNEGEMKEYLVPAGSGLRVEKGDLIAKGQPLIEGNLDLRKLFEVMGREALHRYILREIQEIYASQGEGINDKHIEVIIRQMLSRVRILDAGDADILPGDIVEKDQFEEANEEAVATGEYPHLRHPRCERATACVE